MKTINTIFRRAIVLCCLACGIMFTANAQWDVRKLNLVIDWQMNAPFSTGYTDKISGWGMNYELKYRIAPRWNVGVFASFHTNHQYIGRQTLPISPTKSLTTDQQRSAFQVPFGLAANYTLYDGKHFEPYVGVKAGTMYARNTTYYGINGLYDKAWGGYISPEIGFNIYPCKTKNWGFHVAGYYSYGTNKTYTLTDEINGQNNAGFRVGVIF